MKPQFRFPGPTDRAAIIGPTGSGKTRFGLWLNSRADFKKRPIIALDFKGEEFFKRLERIREIGFEIPRHPGFYHILINADDEDALEKFFRAVWQKKKVGLYIDEGAEINPRSKAFRSLMTQGRSLRISAIMLTQRPVECHRYLFSESDFIAAFPLNDERDNEPIRGLVPRNNVWNFRNPLPLYTSRWYDRKQRYSAIVDPVPSDDVLLGYYEDALRNPVRWS